MIRSNGFSFVEPWATVVGRSESYLECDRQASAIGRRVQVHEAACPRAALPGPGLQHADAGCLVARELLRHPRLTRDGERHVLHPLAVLGQKVGVRRAVVQRLDPAHGPVLEPRDRRLHTRGDGLAPVRDPGECRHAAVTDVGHPEGTPGFGDGVDVTHYPPDVRDVPVDCGIGLGCGQRRLCPDGTHVHGRSGCEHRHCDAG